MGSEYTIRQIVEATGQPKQAVRLVLKSVKCETHPDIHPTLQFYKFEDLPEKYRTALQPIGSSGIGKALFGGPVERGISFIFSSKKEETFVPKPPEPAKAPPEVIDEKFDEALPTVEDNETIYEDGNPPLGPLENVTADFIRELKEIFEPVEVRNILMNNYQINPS